MFNSVTVFALLVRPKLPVQQLEALRSIAWRVGIKYPCIEKFVTTIGPKTSYSDVSMGIMLCVGGLVAKGLSCQGLELRFQLNIMVYLFHAFCKEYGCLKLMKPESLQICAWSMVKIEPQGHVGGRLASGQQYRRWM